MAFADEFAANLLQNPNFYNPLYATERQKKAQEDYATALMKRSTEGATRPTGVIAAMIDQLTSNIYRNASLNNEQAQFAKTLQAGTEQNQATQGGGGGYGGGGVAANNADLEQPAPPPQNVATAGTMPKTLDQQRIAMLRGDTGMNADGTPSLNLSAAPPGAPIRTASLGPAGAGVPPPPPGAPAAGPVLPTGPAAAAAGPPTFDQRYAQAFPNGRGYNPAGNAWSQISPVGTPESRGLAAEIARPVQGTDVYGNPTVTSPIGGMQGQRVGPGVTPGFRAPVTISPEGITAPSVVPAPGRGVPPSGPILGGGQGGVSTATNLTNQMRMAADKTKAVSAIQSQDLETANQAPLIRQTVGIMQDDLRTAAASGKPLPFGPTANWQNEVKRVAADMAPGMMKSEMERLAAADSFDKMSASLTSMLAGSNRSDAALFNNMKSVPGAHNSMQGADALLQMVMQRVNQQEGMRQYITQNSRAGSPEEYLALKDDYFRKNPITNPLTGHPIAMDLAGSAKASGAAPTTGPPVGYQKYYDGSMHTFKGGDWRDKKNWDSGS